MFAPAAGTPNCSDTAARMGPLPARTWKVREAVQEDMAQMLPEAAVLDEVLRYLIAVLSRGGQ